MWAVVDCNSFFASVERVFHPGLKNKPVVVLSNNDGIIVALTPEAKAVGLHRGDPFFKVKGVVERNKVAVFSTNMRLYYSMSKRILSILRQSFSYVENYSIDESFCDLKGYEEYYNLNDLMHKVADRIELWTDIPVSVGVAPSKTLAKMGSKFAKQYRGYGGVCSIDTEEKRLKALEIFPLDDVWGIGRHTLEKLNYYGIRTPLDFASMSENWVKEHLAKPGYMTWKELNGIACIDTTEIAQNQSITTSRTFVDMVTDLDSLRAAVASYASSCANKLRGQQSVCGEVTVFVASNRFRKDFQQYFNMSTINLQIPTDDTIEITKAAMTGLESIFKPGIKYKKAGVILGDICGADSVQGVLFDDVGNREERASLMRDIDNLNKRFGLKMVKLAVEGDTAISSREIGDGDTCISVG